MATTNLSAFIWSVADLLRGDYKQSDYGKVILPFTVLRRLDCVLAPTKAAVLEEKAKQAEQGLDLEMLLKCKAGQSFCNRSALDMQRLMGDPDNIGENLRSYVHAFSPAVRDIFESFEFYLQVDRLEKANLLYLITEKFSQIDLHPETVSNAEMGLVFEELIRRFAELSNETAGEHFTPREVIRLMVNLIFIEDGEALTKPGIVRSLYDPACGTGGMLSVAEEHLVSQNSSARLVLSGQELNPESYAICKADMLIKGQDINNICFGNTLSDDQLTEEKYDYMLSNPPFGVEWKKIRKEIQAEHKAMGFAGRFGPGLPRVTDGSLLFLLHLISKMRPALDGGCRFGIVLNASPLFTGGAGSGESEIRRYVLENDLLEGIIALPTDMFYNTEISTYIWILSNKKPAERKDKVQLIDASEFWQKMRKNLGSKRKELSAEHIDQITKLFGDFEEAEQDGKPISKIFRNAEFGYKTITVERPIRDEDGNVVVGQRGKAKGKPQADSSLRDTENVPLSEEIEDYFAREVRPHFSDAWIDNAKTKTGYEIPFSRHFYVYTPPRPLQEIDDELKQVTNRILEMIGWAIGMSFPDYKEYQDSGLNWLGKVPTHWSLRRLGYFFGERREKVSDRDYQALSVTKDGIVPQLETAAKTDDGDNRKKVCQGDFVINSRSDRKGSAGLSELDGSVSLISTVLKPKESVHGPFAHHLLRSIPFQEEFYRFGKGIVADLWSTNYSSMSGITLAMPLLSEQKGIANFLNHETAKINALIAEQQRLIELLQEKRQAVISTAVTGQIDVRGLVPEEEVAA